VFKGINGNLEVYQKIGEKNSAAIKTLIAMTENTFALLKLHIKTLEQWSTIEYLTTNKISEKIKTMEEW
jgi:hypothetical protein